MQCPSCGAEIASDSTVCPECGLQIEHEPTVAYVPGFGAQHQPVDSTSASHLEGLHGLALVVERGPRAGMSFVLKQGVTTAGRHPDADIFLDDITVSRHHCRFMLEGEQLIVEDSGSTNGTYVNEARVDRTELEPGDEVLVGRFHLLVARGDE